MKVNDDAITRFPETEKVELKPEDIQKAKKKGGIFGDPIIEL